MARLGDICEIVSGSTPKTTVAEYWDGDKNWITPAELSEDADVIYETQRKLTDSGVHSCSLQLLPIGTVLLTSRAPIGKVAIVGVEMYCNQGFKNLICSEHIFNRYLFWFLKGKTDYLNSLGRGATFKEISKQIVGDIEIPLPSLPEQQHIAAVLDQVSELISLRRQQLTKLDELVKARFVEMFGDCDRNRKLEECAVLITKGASPKWQGLDYCDEGTLFVTSENVREGYVDLSKRKYLPNEINKIQPRSILKRNDVLVNIVGASIGRAAIFPSDELANINQAVALVRVNAETLNLQFLITYLNSIEAQKAYATMKKGGARDNLSLKNIADLMIPAVGIKQQNEFAAFVKQNGKSKATVQQSLEKLELLKKSLMQQYFG